MLDNLPADLRGTFAAHRWGCRRPPHKVVAPGLARHMSLYVCVCTCVHVCVRVMTGLQACPRCNNRIVKAMQLRIYSLVITNTSGAPITPPIIDFTSCWSLGERHPQVVTCRWPVPPSRQSSPQSRDTRTATSCVPSHRDSCAGDTGIEAPNEWTTDPGTSSLVAAAPRYAHCCGTPDVPWSPAGTLAPTAASTADTRLTGTHACGLFSTSSTPTHPSL